MSDETCRGLRFDSEPKLCHTGDIKYATYCFCALRVTKNSKSREDAMVPKLITMHI